MRRKEKLTLWPNCLPLPVSSQRAAISILPLIFNNTSQYSVFLCYRQELEARYIKNPRVLSSDLPLLLIFLCKKTSKVGVAPSDATRAVNFLTNNRTLTLV